jgi:hypothetical protein
MMRRSQSQRARWPHLTLRRLERAAGAINPFLLMIAIGLVILNLSCLLALQAGRIPLRYGGVNEIVVPHPVMVSERVNTAPPGS